MASLRLDGRALALRCSYEQRWQAKSVAGYRWHPATKTWRYPASAETVRALREALAPLELDAAVEALLRADAAERARLDAARHGDLGVDAYPVGLRPGISLYEHQRRGIAAALAVPGYALWWEPGCGKSLATIAVAAGRYMAGEIDRMLVVAPLSVVPVWESEWRQWGGVPVHVRVIPARRRAWLAEPWPPGRLQVALVSYESSWRMEDELLAWLRGGPALAVYDESQRIKGPRTKQSRFAHAVGDAAAYRMILSGTPTVQGPEDWWSQFRFLAPDVLGRSWWGFLRAYCTTDPRYRSRIVGYRHQADLVARVHRLADRVRRQDAIDLPPVVSVRRYCDLSAAGRRVYRQVAEDAQARLSAQAKVSAPLIITQLLRLSQIAGGFVSDDAGQSHAVDDAKLRALADVLDEQLADPQRKVVVFARFLAEIRAISDQLRRVGIGHGILTGATKDRGALVRKFQDDDTTRVLVCQLQAGGVGITLHRADTVVFYSLDYSYATYEQAAGRVLRVGQRAQRVLYVHLIARDTIDERVAVVVETKRDLAELVTDRWQEILAAAAGRR